jgi:hypothetical protein
MFQYAATRGVAAWKGYEWCIPDGPKTDDEFEDEENQHKLFMAFKLPSAKVVNMHPAPYKQEASFTFDEDLFNNCEDNVNLYGYFQSEKWFSHIENSIRKDFEWRDDVYNMCGQMFDNITGGQAISLHIRRTDHLIKPTYHPVLPLSYYEEALSKFPSDISVLVFSDDPAWCHEQELFAGDRFLISDSGDNITDMCLMSMCQYQIMANSTYSWWGAWLSNSEHVIAPKLWFGPDGQDPKDIYVNRWRYLDV